MKRLDLVIPDVLAKFEDLTFEKKSFPSMEKLLSKAKVQNFESDFFELSLKRVLQLEGLEREFPFGLIGALKATSTTPYPYWMCADPISLNADSQTLYLTGHKNLELNDDEVKGLIVSLRPLFEEYDIQLVAYSNHQWALNCPHLPKIITNPLFEVLGKNIENLLPSGPDERFWLKLMTESQLLFNQHPVNQYRRQENKPTVDSLWFWGAGEFPKSVNWSYSHCYSSQESLFALAQKGNIPYSPVPDSIEPIFEASAESVLVVETQFHERKQLNDKEAYKHLLDEWEAKWFTPILHALEKSTLMELNLYSCDKRLFKLNKGYLRQFWKKNKSINQLRSDKLIDPL